MKNKLMKSIERSQLAYDLYTIDMVYYKALRIFKANTEIYKLLLSFLYKKNKINNDIIFNYMFHLEDWFEQFNFMEKKLAPELEDVFVFQKLKSSIVFPKEFYNTLKKS